MSSSEAAQEIERQSMEVDVACVGFGPAMGGFLTTLAKRLLNEDGTPALESRALPGAPLQVLCYERADDLSFGVSGVCTRAKAIRASLPDLKPEDIPMATEVHEERVLYLLDPIGASRRSALLKLGDLVIRALKPILPYERHAFRLPYLPPFLRKDGGLILSIGQFNQWVGQQLMGTGLVQLWPGTPIAEALIEEDGVKGVRLVDQGVDSQGRPDAGFMPGMDIRAALTVIGDGPVGPVGRQIDRRFGLPEGHHQRENAVGMKFVVDLRADSGLKPGTILHTFGYPEPEIFGFLYVHPGNVASLGIFVPTWFDSPVRTAYRYLQHWMQHPYLWRYLEGGTLRSWGAKTLGESGRRGEPHLVGNGYARIGEGSGSTNVLTGSGVDEAWQTGVQLAEGVIELAKEGKPFTREHLEQAYTARRRASWIETEGRVAERARDGFQRGFVAGMFGMGLSGLSRGLLNVPGEPVQAYKRLPTIEKYFSGRIAPEEIAKILHEAQERGTSAVSALMDRAGWPAIPMDGKLLVSHQDALLMGGKVQAPAGYADHVVFLYPNLCAECGSKICIEVCSGQAITPGVGGVPAFDREKCVHCGVCMWNCAQPHPDDPERTAIDFRAGTGGLHSSEN